MNPLPYTVYDADHHLYEPEEAFTRHLPKEFAHEFYFVKKGNRTKLVINGMLSDYIPNPTFEVVAAPGSHEKWYRGTNTEGLTMRELSGPALRPPQEWRSGDGRLAVMDQQGVHAALVFPTLASVIEERLSDKPRAMAALFHSLNMWTAEEWGFARENRLFSVPMINLADVDAAIAELDFVLKAGARTIGIRPAPVPNERGQTRSFGYPEFDPFWARVAEAGIFVNLHASDSGYDVINRMWSGGGNEMIAFETDPHKQTLDMLGRAVADSLSALICHGVFARHPNLRVVSVENGASWLAPLFFRLNHVFGQMPKAFAEHPLETFRRHIFVAPFYEDSTEELKQYIPANRILFGSDFPHPEGLANPLDYLNDFSTFSEGEVKQVFHSNMKGLLEGLRDEAA
ncbi:MAG: amidohydrolase [Sphingomonadales bacterium]|nr:amidohydrolase [Sphingomonadales bacterium]MBU3991963.1 amidohydrolase [Alphaproteobacteria bacterium]